MQTLDIESVVQRSRKAVGPVYMYVNINTSVHIKNVTGYLKRAGDHPGTVDCTSKLHSSTLGSRIWGKGDCCPFESPADIVNTTSSGALIEEL